MTTSKTLHKLLAVLLPLLVASAFGASSSFAAEPWWNLNMSTRPATIPSGGEGTIVAVASNLGNATTSGPSSLSVDLPPNVSVVEEAGVPQVQFYSFSGDNPESHNVFERKFSGKPLDLCKATASQITCSTDSQNPELAGLEFIEPLAPYESIEVRVEVKDEGAAPGATYQAEAAGGGAATLARSRPLPVGSNATAFGAEAYSLIPEAEGGAVETRAGAHPYQLTATFNLDEAREYKFHGLANQEVVEAPRLARNLAFDLPPGQIGNPTATPRCSAGEFATNFAQASNACPADTAIGVATVSIDETSFAGARTETVPLFNLEPAYGEPARFGFEILGTPVILDTSVRSGPGEDYGVTVSISDISQLVNFISSTVTFWGVPGDPSHDNARGWACLVKGHWAEISNPSPCEPENQKAPAALLALPGNCNSPFLTSVSGESWTDPTDPVAATFPPLSYSLADGAGNPLALTGCNQLSFQPQMHSEPSADSASSPSGLDFNLNFEDQGLIGGQGRAQSQLKDTTVTLPEGLTINPSAGVGLGGCTVADYERETISSPPGAGCPNDSKLGTVEIETPLLTQHIHGSLYIAQPYENPFGSLVALYIVAKNPETGILIKLAGKVTPNPTTGQLVTTFENNPQLPFSHFNFHFREGAQAPLITPATCGTYQIQALLTPWSEPLSSVTEASSFQITSGVGGGPCPSGGAPPFNPGIEAGMLNNNAGTYSSFYLHLTRGDADQEISGFSTDLPPGLTGNLTGIPFCPEGEIEAARHRTGVQEEADPICPASQVGHTLVGTGVGAVLAYVPGKIYLAGPYDGDPFSLVSVTSAVVGPFDLGTVVIRFGLRIDPHTGQVSVDPSASEPIPTIIDGIVTHVRDIRVYVDRPSFTLNPTSCEPMKIASTLTAHEGASATVTSPFQAASCANLKFEPQVSASTRGKTSKADGASLTYKLTYPSAAPGTYANIAKAKVELPKALPSRLTTLQKACTAKQFATNPAQCPAASVIGHAKAIVPNIPVPIEGPVYFVSNGGEAFPNLVIVLQGYGVTIDLVGNTFISKSGITSTTFKAIPDNPVTSFEITLPEGPYSALAANGNLCSRTKTVTVKEKVLLKRHGKDVRRHGKVVHVTRKVKKLEAESLRIPSEFTGQNGAVLHKTAAISVTGCPKAKKAKHHKRTDKGRK